MTDEEGRVRVGNKYERDQEISSAILFKDLNTNKFRTIWEFANLSEDSKAILGFGENPNKVWFEAYEDGRLAVFSTDLSKQSIEPTLVYSHPKRDVDTRLRYKLSRFLHLKVQIHHEFYIL